MSDDARVQVHIALPNHKAADGETLWARPVDDGYELRNVPFYAYGLSFLDVVAAELREGALQVTTLVRSGGHQTLRLLLAEAASNRARKKVRRELEGLGAAIDEGTDRFWAVDLPEAVDVVAVRELLDGLEEDGVLDYETADEREPDSFDEASELSL